MLFSGQIFLLYDSLDTDRYESEENELFLHAPLLTRPYCRLKMNSIDVSKHYVGCR